MLGFPFNNFNISHLLLRYERPNLPVHYITMDCYVFHYHMFSAVPYNMFSVFSYCSSGETTYNIQEANLYRNKLAKLYENIDLLR